MFKGFPGVIRIADEIFLYKNFISKEEAKNIHSICLNYPNNAPAEEGKGILSKIQDLVKDTHTVTESLSFMRMFPGDEIDVNIDTYLEETEYVVLLYLNDCFNGGEIYYPDFNLEYKPEAGDLIIHHATIKHGVRKVIEGVRYAYPTFLIKNT
jgi:hypothetical protein